MDEFYPVFDTKLNVLLHDLKFEDVTATPVNPVLVWYWYGNLFQHGIVKRDLKIASVERYVRHYQAKRRAAFEKKFSRSKVALFFEGIYELIT